MRYGRRGLSTLAVGAVVLLGCEAPNADAAGDEWPLSRVDRPVQAVDSHDESGAPDLPAINPAVAENLAVNGPPGGTRPLPDLDVSGPMIHPQPAPGEDFPDARFARPEFVRGLYVNAWAAGSRSRMDEMIELVKRTEVNSLVIDIKDATGFVSHATKVPMTHEIGATNEPRIRDLEALLDRLEAEGIYPIARIVVVKDSVLAAARPDFVIQDTAGGVWIDSKGIIWVNPFAEEVWDYNISIAREVAEMGFPEIQWDYIRFPDAPASDYERAVFPGGEGRERVAAIRGFLTRAKEKLADLPVRSTADVFGVTTSFRRDIGLGQLWEEFIDVVDVALPMVYPSHYWEDSFGYDRPNAYPYEIVHAALLDARRRSAAIEGAGLTRPWLQDFTLGAPFYGAPEVRAQIQATYDAGIQEWILWNPSTRYSTEALEPVDGWASEPVIRVAQVLAPVSRRHAVIDSVAALPRPPDTMVETVALADSVGISDSISADSLADTIGVGDTASFGDSVAAVDTTLVVDSVAVGDTSVVVDTVLVRLPGR